MVQLVYPVIVSTKYCDYVYCVCSTKEKAEEIVHKLFSKYNDTDPREFTYVQAVECRLDEIPEELNDD